MGARPGKVGGPNPRDLAALTGAGGRRRLIGAVSGEERYESHLGAAPLAGPAPAVRVSYQRREPRQDSRPGGARVTQAGVGLTDYRASGGGWLPGAP